MARMSGLSAFFLGLCLSPPAFAGGPSPAPIAATPPQVHQTIQRAIGYVQIESAAWLNQRKCAACHHAAMPMWALGEADRHGYTIDKKFLADTTEATLGSREKMMASGILPNPAAPPDPRPMARGVNIGAVFMAAAAETLPALEPGQKQIVKQIVDDAVKKQLPDGSWEFFLSRPPVNESQATDAAWILMSLQGEPRSGDAPPPHRAALEKGLTWLDGAGPATDPQLKLLKLLLALRAGKPRAALQPALDDVLARQRPDGGWGQFAEAPSDAFATGQTLYVLALAGYTAQRPEIQRAINLLVATQKPDGSWPMTSRASPDGKPGGSAKLLTPITCAASSWATMGLARLAPNK